MDYERGQIILTIEKLEEALCLPGRLLQIDLDHAKGTVRLVVSKGRCSEGQTATQEIQRFWSMDTDR